MQTQKWYFRKGELKAGDWDIHIDALNPPTAGWKYTGMRIGQVTPSKSLSISADTNERIVFILEGAQVSVSYKLVGQESQEQILQGRASVFHGSSDYIYIPRQSEVSITGAARIAVGEAPATADRPVQFTSKDKVQITLRGAGRESRQVHNLGMPDTLDADRLLVCEVIVPAGNWSGAPAHKHDCHIPGEESTLEEIYYFESAVTRSAIAPSNSSPFGYFRGFSADARPYDLAEEIHSGDVALVPYGWHGPVAAGPGYDLYFFNVMAGPDPERAWNATDHPDQAWLREAWKSQAPDPRLPYGE